MAMGPACCSWSAVMSAEALPRGLYFGILAGGDGILGNLKPTALTPATVREMIARPDPRLITERGT